MANLLEVKDLNVSIGEKQILNGLNLTVNAGEVHVIMGRNGRGKSTLFSAIVGNPIFKVTNGSILFEGDDITEESADARARRGLFMSFQTPVEIPGVNLGDFIRTAQNAITAQNKNIFSFRKELKKKMQVLNMDEEYSYRDLNVGFSGGEKKKSEILQMLMLNPKLALLDETDSGLDIDAIQNVSKGIQAHITNENAVLIITHSAKLIDNIKVDFVHILDDGKIVKTGTKELADEILVRGFSGTDE